MLVQTHAHAEILFPVGREAFRPQPKVDSAVVRLTPRDAAAELGVTDVPAFLKFAQHCFRHKRKTLRNNLGAVYGLKKSTLLRRRGCAPNRWGCRSSRRSIIS